jgi:hypothetical protein
VAISWSIKFDWDGDGSFAYDESARVTTLAIERGRDDEFSAFSAGKCTLTLENYDRRFDPWYTLSPIYGLVAPRRGVRVVATYGGTDYPLFKGKLEDIEPSGHLGNRMVSVTAYDGLRDLAAVEVPNVAIQTSIATDAAIGLALTAAGWAVGDRDLDAGNDTLGYWWATGDETAKAVCDNLAMSEYGAFFMAADGKATFVNRRNFNTAAASGTLDEDDLADVLLRQPWETIWNRITVRCQPITVGSVMTLWSLRDANVYIAPGDNVEVWAEYKDANGSSCAGSNVVGPVVTTDYTANTVAGGSGTDMTASMTVTAWIYATWTKLVIANTHATTGLYITLLQVRGKPISQTPTPIIAEDTASQATYGKRALPLDVPWQQSVAVATDLATTLKTFYKDPMTSVTVRLDNVLPASLAYELCDRTTLTIPEYTINQVMRVHALTIRTGVTMQDVKAEVSFGPADTTTYWLLGEAGYSELGDTTRLGY